ncbi:MAG: HNH endonuclease [Christensenellaceae bacterium]|nr:HNH endonuclease [Christensenellaceae bacterium]
MRKKPTVFTKEISDFLIENKSKFTNRELSDLVNEKFDVETNRTGIKNFFSNRGIKKYTDPKKEKGKLGRFKKGHIPWNKGIKGSTGTHENCKRTQFKKGNMPIQHRPVGSERINKDGYIEIKVKEPNKWQLKHRHLWEKQHGKIPDGYNVVFLNQNKEDMRIENLALVSRSEMLIVNRWRKLGVDADINKAKIEISKLQNKMMERKKE